MRYLQPQPMVFGFTRAYSAAWEKTFGTKEEEASRVDEALRNNRRRVVLASIKKGRK